VIAAQVALSVVLLVGAGMLVRSLRSLESVNVGLDRDHLMIVDVDETSRGTSVRVGRSSRTRCAIGSQRCRASRR
jgi:hypothetical protein